ncbi:MAG: HAMP domain-containing protein [Acidobacteriota bacterium]|nr:MAG: HAMP domain-containing protein [Acidobacteriota bacterium]
MVVAVFLLIASFIYYIIQRGKLGDTRLASDKTLVMTLAALLLVIAVALAWFMFRQLARVLAGRRHGVLGARLQSRVVFSFLFLVLIPSLTLFAAAITFVLRTLKDLAPAELEQIVSRASDAGDVVYGQATRRARHAAQVLAEELEARGILDRGRYPEGELARLLEQTRRRHDLPAVGVLREGQSPVSVAEIRQTGPGAVRPAELGRLPESLAGTVLETGRAAVLDERLAYGWRVIAVEPLERRGNVEGLVWAVEHLGEQVERRLEAIQLTREEIESFERRRPALQRLYVVVFALLTVVVLFAAVWTGLFLARQVTDPILGLMKGTEALGRGELSHRVDQSGDDEIGHLAASFNRMAAQIQRQQAALEQRRRYIETLLEAIPVGVLSLDTSGRVSTANRAALEALRLESLPADRPLAEVLREGREQVWEVLRPVVAGQTSRTAAEVPIEVEGGTVSLEIAAEQFLTGEREPGALVVLEDLTRLRRAERLAAWGEVARRVAHEIKNPLTPIRLAAERALRRYRVDASAAGPVIEEGVRTIVREVESLKSLVDEFSRFARMPEIRPRAADLSDVVREALSLYGASDPPVRVDTDLASELPVHQIDPEAMRRVVINLLENAVVAAADGGTISVRTFWHSAHQTVVLEVADTGPGIPAADRSRLFLPSFTRRPGGTGLGLAIVHRIVTEHGGWVRAEENPEGGTRMVVELPVAAGTSGEGRFEPAHTTDPGGTQA